MTDIGLYLSLFGVSFLAATILPAFSELGLTGLILNGEHAVWLLVLVASFGNVLGSLVNWFLGRAALRFRDRKWFPASEEQLQKATRWYEKYGRWSLLLSWAPIIGDPLTLAAGVLREPIWSFLALVTLAKTTRYIVVVLIALNLI